jgi:hypothetical protein
MGEHSSITRTGKHEPFGLHVKRGYVQGHSVINKFGAATVSVVEEPIWDGNSNYVYPSSAAVLGVVGTSTTDNSQITIQGVDADYNFVSNIVTLNGTTSVNTSASYLRAYRAFVSDDNEPAGDVTIRHSGTTVAKILEGEGQTLMAIYTVPAGFTGYLYQLNVGSGTESQNKYVTFKLRTREQGGIFRTKQKFNVQGGNIIQEFDFPLKITEKTDIELTAQSSSNDQDVHGLFELLLIENESV